MLAKRSIHSGHVWHLLAGSMPSLAGSKRYEEDFPWVKCVRFHQVTTTKIVCRPARGTGDANVYSANTKICFLNKNKECLFWKLCMSFSPSLWMFGVHLLWEAWEEFQANLKAGRTQAYSRQMAYTTRIERERYSFFFFYVLTFLSSKA